MTGAPSHAAATTVLHASCVAFDGRALLITGASGSGKSGLALTLMAHGGALIADDCTELRRAQEGLIAAAPATLPPLIEARGIGLLHAVLHPPCPLSWVVDMDRAPDGRLPFPATCDILGLAVPLLAGRVGPHLGVALVQLMTSGLATNR